MEIVDRGLDLEQDTVENAIVEQSCFVVAVVGAEHAIAALGQLRAGRVGEVVAGRVHDEDSDLGLGAGVHRLVEHAGLASAKMDKGGFDRRVERWLGPHVLPLILGG